jgi:hypothetical protein
VLDTDLQLLPALWALPMRHVSLGTQWRHERHPRETTSCVPVGIWNRRGVMDEEFIIFDQLTFMRQLGLA